MGEAAETLCILYFGKPFRCPPGLKIDKLNGGLQCGKAGLHSTEPFCSDLRLATLTPSPVTTFGVPQRPQLPPCPRTLFSFPPKFTPSPDTLFKLPQVLLLPREPSPGFHNAHSCFIPRDPLQVPPQKHSFPRNPLQFPTTPTAASFLGNPLQPPRAEPLLRSVFFGTHRQPRHLQIQSNI
jgi:hypothetical protein